MNARPEPDAFNFSCRITTFLFFSLRSLALCPVSFVPRQAYLPPVTVWAGHPRTDPPCQVKAEPLKAT